MKIAILGGTFNPVHTGHLRVAENALASAGLDRVILVPCGTPPHKNAGELAGGSHRLAMLRLAIAGNPRLETSDCEIVRGGVSYSVDTVAELRRRSPDDRFSLIVGSDNFHEIGTWRRFGELVTLCDFLVIERPGCPLRLPPASVPAAQLPLLRFEVFQGPTVEIASSGIRDRIREGKNVSPWLAPSVYDYIRQHHLYETSR